MTILELSLPVESPDVCVVGASAAGLAATLAAARAGARVLLLEAKARIGDPPAPAIVGFDFLWPAAIARPPASVRRRLAGARLRGSDGRGPLVDAPLTLFDRARLDAHLAQEAQDAGARIVTGVRDLRARDDATLVADGVEIAPRALVFADGARTLAARFLRPTHDPARLAWGAILDVEAKAEAHDRILITLGPHAPGGRSQLNPLGEGRWSHWTFFHGEPADAERVARRALALDARLTLDTGYRARFVGVAPDPVYTLPRELARGRVMVVGGAAGQGGLEVGLASGLLAGDAAARYPVSSAGRAYARAWRSRYQRGYARLRRAADALAQLTDAETRALLGAWDGARLTPDAGARVLLARPGGAAALARAALLAWARQ